MGASFPQGSGVFNRVVVWILSTFLIGRRQAPKWHTCLSNTYKCHHLFTTNILSENWLDPASPLSLHNFSFGQQMATLDDVLDYAYNVYRAWGKLENREEGWALRRGEWLEWAWDSALHTLADGWRRIWWVNLESIVCRGCGIHFSFLVHMDEGASLRRISFSKYRGKAENPFPSPVCTVSSNRGVLSILWQEDNA